MPRIDPETVQRILDAADIVEVVSDFVKLRRSGANYKGLCPFHNERTPSFSVNKARNICKCFSCGKGGTPVGFIMEHEQLSYQEALRYLARKYNIEIIEKELTQEEREAANDRESMLTLNEYALKNFEENLSSTAEGRDIALQYFRHRGLNDAMIARFHLGYALQLDTAFTDKARSDGFSDKFLLATGLSGLSTRGGEEKLYDRFHGRVIFPVHSISGRVVAFGARTMRSDKAVSKYVNSPESIIYKKNQELYGLFQAKNAIARKDECILVEGYLDVISMHQVGVENVVASSGTSLTEGQIRALRRFTSNVTLIYDADAAGIKASLRGINLLLSENINVKVLMLPPGEDPDSFAQHHSSLEVEQYIAEHKEDIVAFMVRTLMAGVPSNDPTARAKVVNEILSTIARVTDQIKRQEYISQCAGLLNIPEEVLVRQLNIFIGLRLEEDEKELRREAARASIADLEENKTQDREASEKSETGNNTAPLLDLSNMPLKPYEAMLIRYLVRYGLLYVVDIVQSDESVLEGTVFDMMDCELALDGIKMTWPPYVRTYEYVRDIRFNQWPGERAKFIVELDLECERKSQADLENIRRTAGTISEIEAMEKASRESIEDFRRRSLEDFDMNFCQSRLCNSSDDEVRQVASEMVVDRYTLSKIYSRQGNNRDERDELKPLVERAVNELRNAIVTEMIVDLNKKLQALSPDDTDAAIDLMQQIADHKAYQNELVKILGDRIILPKN